MSARGVSNKDLSASRKIKRAAIKGINTGFLALLGTEHSIKSTLKYAFPSFNKRDINKVFDLFLEEGLLVKKRVAGDMYRYMPTDKFYKVLAKELPDKQRMDLRKKAIAKLGTKAAVFFDV